MGYVFIATTTPLCKLQTFKVKALQFITHCFLRQERFEAAEVAGKFTFQFARSKFCLKCINGCDVKERLCCSNLPLQQQIHRQEVKQDASSTIIISTQGTNFKIEDKNLGTDCVSKLLGNFNPFAIFSLLITSWHLNCFPWLHFKIFFILSKFWLPQKESPSNSQESFFTCG